MSLIIHSATMDPINAHAKQIHLNIEHSPFRSAPIRHSIELPFAERKPV